MSERKGTISVQTADIFPIIKKWLYSEHDIFLRELIANGTDAITKRATLARTKNQEIPEGKISVILNKDNNTIVISDNGLGMTEQEVEKYIAQLAFSGAEEFAKQLQASGSDKAADIIGKFGLGFYSSFMVASTVEIDTLSMQEGSQPVKWTCSGDTEYSFSPSERTEVGTSITLHLNDDGKEFLDEYKVASTLRNFCDFMPYSIEVMDLPRWEKNQAKLKEQEGKKDIKPEDKVYPYHPQVINETKPLWKQDPNNLKDQDYLDFFRKLYPGEQDPLFWIHLNVDHPFILEGILYFPKINPYKMPTESQIRLYCKQVFVSSNVKNVIPDFLSLIKGVIDSTDIPLNVSRSALQGDPNIRKISNYVIKKVADSLKKLAKSEREKYEKIWGDIGIFVKYGVISDTKFDELMRPYVLFATNDNKYFTQEEYFNSIPEKYKEKLKEKILYFEKEKFNTSIVKQLQEEGINVVEVNEHIDPHYMQHVEIKKMGDQAVKFVSADAEISNILETESSNDNDVKLKELFAKILGKDKKDYEVELGKFKNASAAAFFKVDEHSKRMQNMFKSMGQDYSIPLKKTLVINPNNPLIQNVLKISENKKNKGLVEKLCFHLEDLALMSSEGLKQEDRERFICRGQELMKELTDLVL